MDRDDYTKIVTFLPFEDLLLTPECCSGALAPVRLDSSGTFTEMLRVFGVLAAAVISLSTLPGTTSAAELILACTCGSLDSQIEQADAVFIGQVRDISVAGDGPAGREVLWNVDVERLFEGPDAAVIAVSGGGEPSNCRVDLEPGMSYGIVAFWRSGHLATSQCGVTTPRTLEALMTSPVRGGDSLTIVVVAGAALFSLVAVALLRLRRAKP